MTGGGFTYDAGTPPMVLPAAYITASSSTPSIGALTKGLAPTASMVLVDIDYYNEGTGNVATKHYAARGLIYPDNTAYESRVLSPVTITQEAIDSVGFGGRVALTISEIQLRNDDRALDALCFDGDILGRNIVIRAMPAYYDDGNRSKSDLGGGNLSNAATVFTGVVAAIAPDGMTMRLTLADLTGRLTVPLQPNLFDGSGGTGGTPDLKGAPKPVTLGFCFNVTPVSLGNVDFGDGALPTFMSHWRGIYRHSAVRIRGVDQAASSSVPTVGQYRDWPQYGCFQLGSSPDGVVTADLQGDAPAGAYAGSTADIISRLLTSLGPSLSTSDLDTTSFTILANGMAGEIGWFHGADAILASDALDEICSRQGVWLAGGRDGKLRVSLAQGNLADVQAVLEAGNIVSLEPEPLPQQLATPPSSVQVGYALNWTPLSDIAGVVYDGNPTLAAALAGQGSFAISNSAAIAARVKPAQPLQLQSLYRYQTDAQTRADALRTWAESELQAFRVRMDRYRAQLNIGHVGNVSYPLYGISGGFLGVTASWSEDPQSGQTEVVIIG